MPQTVFTTDVARGAVTWHGLPEEILLPPISLSGRHSYDEADITSLAYEIADRGQDTPVLIRKTKQGKPMLVYGRRRYLAVKEANKLGLGKKGPIQLIATYEADMSDEDALIAAIAENWQRKEVTDADHAHNIGQLMKFAKKTPEQVAKIYFPKATTPEAQAEALRWVKVRAGIDAELTDEGKQAMREGVLTVTAAAEMTKLPPETQQAVIAEAKSKDSKKVKGKARIKVSDVKKHKPVPAKAAGKASGKPAPAPAAAPKPAPVVVKGSVFEAAEDLARAVDAWRIDATSGAEKALIAAHDTYRKLVPLKKSSAA